MPTRRGAPAGWRRSSPRPAWRTNADGSTVFRLTAPLVAWWVWVVLAAASLGDLAVQGRDRASAQIAIAIVALTGIMYACALRPRVIADRDGLTVHNPIRDHRMPWGAVTGIFLAESVEFSYARPAPKKDKTVASWALYTRRRARASAQLRRRGRSSRGWLGGALMPEGPAGDSRMPPQAREVARTSTAELMARELSRLRQQAGEHGAHGAGGGTVTGTWAWQPLAAIIIPVAGFALAVLVP